MGDETATAGVEDRIGIAEPVGHVVGVEDRQRSGPLESVRAHERDVGPRDRQDARRAERGSRDGSDHGSETVVLMSIGTGARHDRMGGEERGQMGAHRHGSDAGTSTTMRDAEGLVEVEVAHVRTEPAGSGHSHQCVEVRAVEIHLPAGFMHGVADLTDGLLEDTMGGWVGDHECSQLRTMEIDLLSEIAEIDVAVAVAGHHDNPHPGHRRTGRVRAMGRGRDEADGAFGVTVAAMPGADGEQSGELALGAGVRLQGHGVVSGDLGQPAFEISDDPEGAHGVLRRGERVQIGEPRPGDRLHLHCSVELHGAGPERDHRAVEGEVEVGELPEMAHHVCLAVERGEVRMFEEGSHAPERFVDDDGQLRRRPGECAGDIERGEQGVDVGCAGGLVAAQRQMICIDEEDVDPMVPSGALELFGPTRHARGDRVEEPFDLELDAGGAEPIGEQAGEVVHPFGDRTQTVRTVPAGVEGGHHGEEHLCGADVGGRLLASDVLLTGLEGEAMRPTTGGIDGHPDESSGQDAAVCLAGGQEPGARTPETHRHAESLGGTHDHIGTELTGRSDHAAGQEIGDDDDECASGMGSLGDGTEVAQLAARSGMGHQNAEGALRGFGEVREVVGDHDADAERLGPGGDHRECLGVGVGIDDEHRAGLRIGPHGQGHPLGSRGRLVEHRGVRQLHAREVAHHRLEGEEHLEPPLGDLGLVRGVGGVPRRVLEHVAAQDRGRDRPVVPLPDHRGAHGVAVGEFRQCGEHRPLVAGFGQGESGSFPDAGRHDGVHELVDRLEADSGEHRVDLTRGRTDMAADEGVGGRGVGVGGHRGPPWIRLSPVRIARRIRTPICRWT